MGSWLSACFWDMPHHVELRLIEVALLCSLLLLPPVEFVPRQRWCGRERGGIFTKSFVETSTSLPSWTVLAVKVSSAAAAEAKRRGRRSLIVR